MAHIVLTDEQLHAVRQALEPIEVRDEGGRILARIGPEHSPAFIAEMRRRAASPGPFYTSEQVRSRLRALQAEWDRTGGFDEVYMRDFLNKLDATDPGHMRSEGKAG